MKEVRVSDLNQFMGFNRETVQFFLQLKKNNDRDWFRAHKKDFEDCVLNPARAFVVDMGERLRSLSPDIMAVPKIDRSLFRLNRDTRFSPDKSPYKTHLGIYFWEGVKPRMECSGFYFHLEPPHLLLGVGIYIFPKTDLHRYRKAVVNPETGEALFRILKKMRKMEKFELGGKFYKRIPHGFESSFPHAELLQHNGLYAGETMAIPQELYSGQLVDFCWEKYKNFAPLHRWLVSIKIGHY
jgi:uncharacterized protein (TIGR02453 family)